MIYMIATLRGHKDELIGFRLLDTKAKKTTDIWFMQAIMAISSGKAKVENLEMSHSDLKGVNGSIERYSKVVPGQGLVGKAPLVILAKTSDGNFICSDYKGNIAELDNDRALRYAYDYENGVANGKIVDYKISAIEGNYPVIKRPIMSRIINPIQSKIKAYNKKCIKDNIKPFDFKIEGASVIVTGAYEWQEDYNIPDFVTEIDNWAFSDNWVEHVDIPNGVIRIGDGAFENCKELRTVKIPSSIYEIGDDVFKGCGKLEYIKIPAQFKDKLGNIYNCKIETY